MKKKEYKFSNDIGDAVLSVYEVFPGVQLVYSSVHMDRFDLRTVIKGNMIAIHHCREGRIEQEFPDECFYLMPGDFAIAVRTEMAKEFQFPLRHYHGIAIGIQEEAARQWLSQFMKDIHVQPLEVAKRLCQDRASRIFRSDPRIENIFAELYSVPETIKAEYLKLKIMELFVVLSGMEEQKQEIYAIPKNQVQLAKRISAYLHEHMGEHITIPELAKEFHISQTQLKMIFKEVYGVPVFTYMRIQRMQSAAQLLIHTDQPIADIAYEFGYHNGGKFSSAFQKIMWETPAEYRKAHRK